MFNNAKQSVPELFKEKILIDKEVEVFAKIKAGIVRDNKVIDINALNAVNEKMKPLLERQATLSRACEQFITRQRVTGKDNRG